MLSAQGCKPADEVSSAGVELRLRLPIWALGIERKI